MTRTAQSRWNSCPKVVIFRLAIALAIGLSMLPIGDVSGAPLPAGGPSSTPKIMTWRVTSTTQTKATVYFETDQPTRGFVDYGLTTNLGRIRPTVSGPEATTHTITLSPLKPDTTYYFRVRADYGTGQVTTRISSIRTPPAAATAKLVVTKKNTAETHVLPGACFALFAAGSGAYVAEYCDRYDTASNDGKVIFPALAAGNYLLIETRSPAGYALARNTRLTVAAGQTLNLTVVDPRGGTLLSITKRDENGSPVDGACFIAYKNVDGRVGDFVAWGSDDYDGNDGVTTLGNLRSGAYFVYEGCVPDAYIAGERLSLTVVAGQPSLEIEFSKYSQGATGNVQFRSVDANGNPLSDACYSLFTNGGDGRLGTFLEDSCDRWDGQNDGSTFFTEVPAGSYVAVEYHAPSGHIVGKKFSFTKVDGRRKVVNVTQTPGGVTLRVKTVKNNSSTALRGVCYSLFVNLSGRYEYRTGWCDNFDGASDGVTQLAGLKPGTYYLQQYNTPSGYAMPVNRAVTIGTSNTTVTVKTMSASTVSASEANTPTPAASPVATAAPTMTPTAVPESTPVPNERPIASAGADQGVTDVDGTGGELVMLDGAGSVDPEGGSLSYSWRIDGAEIATGASAAIALAVGTHTITLTVTDEAGNTATDEVLIVVEAPPAPVVDATPSVDQPVEASSSTGD